MLNREVHAGNIYGPTRHKFTERAAWLDRRLILRHRPDAVHGTDVQVRCRECGSCAEPATTDAISNLTIRCGVSVFPAAEVTVRGHQLACSRIEGTYVRWPSQNVSMCIFAKDAACAILARQRRLSRCERSSAKSETS